MNNVVKFVVTRNQFERIKQMAESNNITVSAFIRQKILKPDYMPEKMIIEIYNKVVKNEKKQ